MIEVVVVAVRDVERESGRAERLNADERLGLENEVRLAMVSPDVSVSGFARSRDRVRNARRRCHAMVGRGVVIGRRPLPVEHW